MRYKFKYNRSNLIFDVNNRNLLFYAQLGKLPIIDNIDVAIK